MYKTAAILISIFVVIAMFTCGHDQGIKLTYELIDLKVGTKTVHELERNCGDSVKILTSASGGCCAEGEHSTGIFCTNSLSSDSITVAAPDTCVVIVECDGCQIKDTVNISCNPCDFDVDCLILRLDPNDFSLPTGQCSDTICFGEHGRWGLRISPNLSTQGASFQWSSSWGIQSNLAVLNTPFNLPVGVHTASVDVTFEGCTKTLNYTLVVEDCCEDCIYRIEPTGTTVETCKFANDLTTGCDDCNDALVFSVSLNLIVDCPSGETETLLTDDFHVWENQFFYEITCANIIANNGFDTYNGSYVNFNLTDCQSIIDWMNTLPNLGFTPFVFGSRISHCVSASNTNGFNPNFNSNDVRIRAQGCQTTEIVYQAPCGNIDANYSSGNISSQDRGLPGSGRPIIVFYNNVTVTAAYCSNRAITGLSTEQLCCD